MVGRVVLWSVYLVVLCLLAWGLAHGIRVHNPKVSPVHVELLRLVAPNELEVGESAPVSAEFRFDRAGDYLVRLELCAAKCETLRWGIPVGDATGWQGGLGSLDPEPGSYEAILSVRERFETVFFRTVFEHRWAVVVHEP